MLQALPKRAKAITTWKNREQAFANIAKAMNKIIQQMQQEEKYSIQEYGLAFDYYTLMDVQTQEELTALERFMHHKAEQWLHAIQDAGGILREVNPEQAWWQSQLFVWKKWLFTQDQLSSSLHMRSHKNIYAGRHYDPIFLRVCTPHFALLNHFMDMGQLP